MSSLSRRTIVSLLGLGLLAVTLTSIRVSATPFPGPDAAGYSGQAIPFNLRDVSTTGTFVPLSDDQLSGTIALPFPFQFYGNTHTGLAISSNGFVTFSPSSNGCCSGRPLPSADGINNLIAGYWEDLNAPQGNIRYGTVGTAPNREFVVGFYNVHHFFRRVQVTFEIILHENGRIELQYGNTPSDGGRHSAGIENADGTIGLQVAFGNFSMFNQGFLLRQHLPIVTIASVNDAFCPIRASMSIFDDEHSLSGAVNVYGADNPYPGGLSQVKLEILHSSCGGADPMSLTLDSTIIDSFVEDASAVGFCSCNPGIETRVITGAGLAAWDPAAGATNTFSLTRAGASGNVRFAWARVVLSGPGQPDRTFCVADFNGGNCSETNLCSAQFTFGDFSESEGVGPQLSLVASVPYTNSTLPSSVSLSAMTQSSGVVELTANDGINTVSTSMPFEANACSTLSINNVPPTAVCQSPVVPTDPGVCTASGVSVDNGSSDVEGPLASIVQAPDNPFSLGTTPVTLTATDSDGATASCQAVVTVVDQEPPVVTCQAPQVLECSSPNGTGTTVSATAADNCSVGPAACSAPALFGLGSTNVGCSATDASGNEGSCLTSVTVQDTTPPTIGSAIPSEAVLWPPNHRLVPVTINVSVADVCDPGVQCQVVSVQSNEPDNGLGDGDIAGDATVTGPLTVAVRAERSGGGTGRVYTVLIRCTDGAGNHSTKTTTVSVPHDRGR